MKMTQTPPENIAIVVLGRSAMALAERLRAALPGARIHGPRHRAGDCDIFYERAVEHIAALFAAGRPIVGICASGILIRAVASLLAAKAAEPPVVALAEDGSVAVPLLGGHRGANALARVVAEAVGAGRGRRGGGRGARGGGGGRRGGPGRRRAGGGGGAGWGGGGGGFINSM